MTRVWHTFRGFLFYSFGVSYAGSKKKDERRYIVRWDRDIELVSIIIIVCTYIGTDIWHIFCIDYVTIVNQILIDFI